MSDLSDKRVFITGADGFIGSHLTERLVKEGATVKALAQYNSFNNRGWLESVPKHVQKEIEVVSGDVRDDGSMMSFIKDSEYVFHLASLIAIPYSYIAPSSYVDTNIKGTLNVLQACRAHSVARIIHTSTSEVYGTAQYVPIDEIHPLQGQSPYSASKIGADMLAESFYRSFGTPVVTVRPFNTYGPRQSLRAVIPTIISQLLSGNPDVLVGSLSPTRDFNYVNDTVEGYIRICKHEQTIGEVINIGSGKEISIGSLIDKIASIIGVNYNLICENKRLRPAKSEVNRLCASNSKLRKITGWVPETSLDTGLVETIEWMKDNLNHSKAGEYIV